MTFDDICDQITPEIFKNNSVIAPRKLNFGPQKIKLQEFSSNAFKTLMKSRKKKTEIAFKTMKNYNFFKHSQDDRNNLPQVKVHPKVKLILIFKRYLSRYDQDSSIFFNFVALFLLNNYICNFFFGFKDKRIFVLI